MLKFYVLSVLIFAILFGIEFFAIYKCTLKKAKRPSHIISTAVIAVLSCVEMLFLSEIISGIDWFLQLDGVKMIVSLIFGSIQAITMTGMLLALLLLNLATLLAGLAIKSICNIILSRIPVPSGTYNPFAAIIRHFYETGEPYITCTKATVYRKWLLWAKHSIFALFALSNLALLTLVFFVPDLINQSSGSLLRIMILLFWVPTVSYLIINEMYYFLKGYDKYDEDYDYETEGISGTNVGDYSKLLRIYEETAGKANLIRTYSYNRTGVLDMFTGGKAKQATKCDSEVQAVYEMIENKIKNTGVDICDEYANALVSMLNRNDVFVADTIIGEFSQYLFNYLNYQLCCNRKIIILCNSNIYSDKNRLTLYMKMIRKNFRGINGYGDIWRIGTFESLRQNETIDILLSSYEEYVPEYTHRASNRFFDNVSVCVFLECLDLFGNDQFYSKAVFSHLEHLNSEIQYIFLSQSNSIMLKNAIDSMMNEHHPVAFYKNSNALKNLYVFIWKSESYFKPQISFDNNAKYYYGTALPIGIIGARYGVEKVNIIDCEETPYITYQHIMKDRAAEIEKAADSEYFLRVTGNSNQRGWGKTGANGANTVFTGITQQMAGDVIWDSISTLDLYLTQGSALAGAVVDDETNAGSGGDGYCRVVIDGSSVWVVTGNSVVSDLECAGSIMDVSGNSVTIIGTDGTVYAEGSSEYTITVSSYTTDVDLEGAGSIDSFEAHNVL